MIGWVIHVNHILDQGRIQDVGKTQERMQGRMQVRAQKQR